MAVTTTPRFALPQWGAGADTPSRVAFNDAFAKIDAGAAKDTGAVGTTSLPTTGLTDGMYAQTVDGPYRRMFRRAGGAWQAIGGNTWSEQTYHRADSALATGAPARTVSHPGLNNPGAVENWDGSSVRGGRQAIGDVNSGQPGALHVGDTDIAVDLATRGRVYARTRAAGERGFVAAAHNANAGPLFAAREAGGTDPWSVDSQGRMRAQAPTAFGAVGFSAGAPFASAPGADHITAADLYAAAGKAALQVLRAIGDQTPIARFEQDRITLGRSSWSGARIDLISPDTRVTGPFAVSGATSLAGLSAGATSVSSLSASGQVTAQTVSASGQVSAEGGLVQSSAGGGGATLLSRPPVQYSGTSQASLRQPHCGYSVRSPSLGIPGSSSPGRYDMPVYMPEAGWMRLDTVLRVQADLGLSNTIETLRFNVTFQLLDSSGNLIEGGYTHVNAVPTDDTSRQIAGYCGFTITDLFWTRIPAGNYFIRMIYVRGSVLGGWIETIRYITTPVVLANVNSS